MSERYHEEGAVVMWNIRRKVEVWAPSGRAMRKSLEVVCPAAAERLKGIQRELLTPV